MSQKAPKEQMPALIAELANRSANIEHMEVMKHYIARVQISGAEAIELGRAINWLHNVAAGEKERCAQIKALLPDQDTEIKLDQAPEVEAVVPPPTAVGSVEMSKGSEVLQPA